MWMERGASTNLKSPQLDLETPSTSRSSPRCRRQGSILCSWPTRWSCRTCTLLDIHTKPFSCYSLSVPVDQWHLDLYLQGPRLLDFRLVLRSASHPLTLDKLVLLSYRHPVSFLSSILVSGIFSICAHSPSRIFPYLPLKPFLLSSCTIDISSHETTSTEPKRPRVHV